jgi:hypothetical protein
LLCNIKTIKDIGCLVLKQKKKSQKRAVTVLLPKQQQAVYPSQRVTVTTVVNVVWMIFVALPVEKGGSVLRFQNIYASQSEVDLFVTSFAYGIDAKQTLLLGMPYRLKPSRGERQGDISLLYRYILLQDDSFEGTSRFALLAGAIIPTASERDYAAQAGFVYTYFRDRHEIDVDIVYKKGFDARLDTGNYDLSWQYRVMPDVRDDWGITQELNTVVELNGRWIEGRKITHQATLGLQWIHADWVLEGGYIKDLNNAKEERYLLSVRVHF